MSTVLGQFYVLVYLTLSWRRPLSYRNQSIDLRSITMDWFLYDNGPRHERVKQRLCEKFILQPFWVQCSGQSYISVALSMPCVTKSCFIFFKQSLQERVMPYLFQVRYVCDMCAICAWYVHVMCTICVRQKAMFQLIKNDFWGICFFF